jgi:hypothetical protein
MGNLEESCWCTDARGQEMSAGSGQVRDMGSSEALVKALLYPQLWIRRSAAEALIELGDDAVGPLLKAAACRDSRLRKEAIRTLGRIHNHQAAASIVAALDDESWEVRWVAAEAVIGSSSERLPVMLETLSAGRASRRLLGSAHHILSDLAHQTEYGVVLPVLQALEGKGSPGKVARAARAALNAMRPARRAGVANGRQVAAGA